MDPGVAVAPAQAQATRTRLQAAGVLHPTLKVLQLPGQVVFPVTDASIATGEYEFEVGNRRHGNYQELLPAELRELAPRAYDQLGDIVLVRIPEEAWNWRQAIGAALLQFHKARAVFHDGGVTGEFRTRKLQRIAGEGGSQTTVVEHGTRLFIDPGAAYYSPRLATHRAHMLSFMKAGQRLIDMFAGIGPLTAQAVARGLDVVHVDLNPAACELAKQNGVATVLLADAHTLDILPADHVVMNLPHGAKEFIGDAARLCLPGGLVHYHEILEDAQLDERKSAWVAAWKSFGRSAEIVEVRHVRTYSPGSSHWAATFKLA